jgi:hypothetical protein
MDFFYRADSAMAKRAALGLELRSTGTKRDTLGVFVDAVTPKGPAEASGIVEGDRIASINGVDLRTSAADTEDSYTNGLAAHRLTREVQKLTPGARVNLRVYSGGRFRDVQVTAGKASEVLRLGDRFRFGVPGGADGVMQFGPEGVRMGRELQLQPDRMPLMRERLQPIVRQRFHTLEPGAQFRVMPLRRTMAPVRRSRIYKVDGKREGVERAAYAPSIVSVELGDDFVDAEELLDFPEPWVLDTDDEPFEFENEIEPVSPEVIRDLAATAIRSARDALARLAADGIA